MFEEGQYFQQSNVVAYALYNIAATSDNNAAPQNRASVTSKMTAQEVKDGKKLTNELSKSDNLMGVINQYVTKHPANRKAATIKQLLSRQKEASKDGLQDRNSIYPGPPAKQSGITSCNTRCNNADCYRTYDDGRHVHFMAKQKWDPFESTFTWDAGGC